MKEREKKITQELPLVNPKKLVENREHLIYLSLSEKQIRYIEYVAKQYNLSYSEAFKQTFDAAFSTFMQYEKDVGRPHV